MRSLLVSIIIPTFNSEHTLRRAINSVVSQTYQNWEIWIVDGYSTDHTVDTVRDYALADQRIQYVSELDDGIYDAMNKGIRLARGEWLYFMGSDDQLSNSNIISNVLTQKNTEGNDILYGNVYLNGNIVHGIFDASKLVRTTIPHQSIFYRKELFEKYGYYDSTYKCRADYLLTIELFFETNVKWKYIDEVIAHYSDGGYSDTVYDKEFDKIVEKTFLKYFSGCLRQKDIYLGMLWTVPYNLREGSITKALRILWNSGKLIEYIPHILYWTRLRAFAA